MWHEFGRLSRLPAQSVLWEKGDPCTEVVLLVEGELDVLQQSLEGEVAVVRTMHAGEILGEMSALDGGSHSATVRARVACQLRRIPVAEFRGALEGNLKLVHDLLARQNERVRWLTRQVAVLGFESVAQRIARLLTRDTPAQDGPLKLTHKDLAERVAATRESVTKALGLLQRQGFLELGRGSISILDRPGLDALAEETLIRRRLALALSAAGSPFVVLPLFWLVLVAESTHSAAAFWFWSTLSIGLTTGLPALYVLSRVRSGQLTDVHVRLREQRRGPFRVALLAGLALLAVMVVGRAPERLIAVTVSMLVNGLLFATISRSWKISLHTGMLSSCLTSGVILLGWPPSVHMLVPPLVWARAERGRHLPSQGMAGWLLGSLSTALVLRWWFS